MPAPAQKTPTAYQIVIEAISETQKLFSRAAGFFSTDARRVSIEICESIQKAMGAWAALIVGGILFGTGLVQALVVYAPALPSWIGYLLTGSAVLITGAMLFAGAQTKLGSLDTLGEHATEVADDAVLIAGQVNDVVVSARESIQSGVDSVKSTVESIRHATDISYQVERRPWTMFATAAGLGFVGGTILISAPPKRASHLVHSSSAATTTPETGPAGDDTTAEYGHAPAESGFVAKLGELLAPQATLARELAIGALFSLARDFAHDAVAKPMVQPVDDFFNDAARKFGGRPLARGALGDFQPGHILNQERPQKQ